MPIRLNGVDKPSTINEYNDTPQGAYHLADNPNLFEPQRSNNFDLVVVGLDNIVRAGMLETDLNGLIPNAQETLRLSVNSAFIPHFTQDVIPVRRGNTVIKAAGIPTFGEGEIVVNDYIGAQSADILLAWQNLSYNVKTEKVGLLSDYKKEAYLTEYTPDWQVVRRWRIHGCWISGLSESPMSSDNSDKREISATIQYDWGEIDTSEIE